jgi:phage N-6-adenine-methyltransferase
MMLSLRPVITAEKKCYMVRNPCGTHIDQTVNTLGKMSDMATKTKDGLMNTGLMSSIDQTWETPQNLFDKLNLEFGFTLDAAASAETAKCAKYYSAEDSLFNHSLENETVFMNPPYSREIGEFMRYARTQTMNSLCTTVVCLVPARTDARWFQDTVFGSDLSHASYTASEVRFIKGRIKFGEATNSAPFPSALIIFRSMFHPFSRACPLMTSYALPKP